MQRKITWLSSFDPDNLEPDHYGNVYINMKFDDGTLAYKGGKPAAMTEHYAALKAIGDSLVEFELEDDGKKTNKGTPKLKLVAYPGWTAAPAPGEKKSSWSEAWYSSEEGVRFTQDKTDRRTALMQAAIVAEGVAQTGHSEVTVLQLADEFYQWLSGAAVATVSDNGEAQTSPSNSPAPVGVLDSSSGQPGTPSGGVGPDGEAGSASSATHEHQWVPSPKLKSFDICVLPDCYETQKRVKTDA